MHQTQLSQKIPYGGFSHRRSQIISNQLSGVTTISITLWNIICSTEGYYIAVWKKLQKTPFQLPWRYGLLHAHKAERTVNLPLGRSSISISKVSFPPFKLRNNSWNNVETHRTKKKLLDYCSYVATQPWLVQCHYRVTSHQTANWPQICTLSGR